MRALKQVLIELLVVLTLSDRGGASEIIYDNTGQLGGYGWTALQQGDEIYAAGSQRFVTRLTIGVSRQNEPGTADFQARLYANDAINERPGTLLWQSPVLANVHLYGGVQLIPFDVPQVLVPDTFTWTLQILGGSPGAAVGLVNAGPPLVGISPNFDWFGGPDSWTKLQYSDWMARVEAVPEPTSVGFLLFLGGLDLLLIRKEREPAK